MNLRPYLSLGAVWAFSVGTSIGWGSLVVTSTSYLSQAGPWGSGLGLGCGAFLMLLVGVNFSYLIRRFPDAGGVYTYTKHVFGYDRAFLVSWFTSLIYLAMFWANTASLPLYVRYLAGDVLRVGYLYTVFDYPVYLGEVGASAAAILLITALCMNSKRGAARLMIALAGLFTLGITVCFAAALLGHRGSGFSFSPSFVPDKAELGQVVRIAFISPWAFIGFESVSHSSEEYDFRSRRIGRVLLVSVLTSLFLYLFVTVLSVTAYPEECESWFSYISHLDEYEGLAGLPAFYAARYYLGDWGVWLLMASLLALVVTSLIGNLQALSRLFCALGRDNILPRRFSSLNAKGIPADAMALVAVLSLAVLFLGRTVIGWTVDVTSIGSTLLYGFVSAAVFKTARKQGERFLTFTGGFSFVLMLLFGTYLLFPNLFSDDTLETESYILLIFWSILGLIYFRSIIAKDHARRFGKAIIVWIALLALVFLLSLVWSGRRDEGICRQVIYGIQAFYESGAGGGGLSPSEFIREQIQVLHRSNVLNTSIVNGIFLLALGAMLINHFSMRRWEQVLAKERDSAREVAYRDPLTGVKSKHAYVEHETMMADRIYRGKAGEFAIVVCDVNGLKQVNDTMGHKAGDQYIQEACEMICGSFKRSPVFRIGGDEFAVILQGKDYEDRFAILERLNAQLERNIGTGKVVASLGLADFDPETDHTFHAVFTKADGRMYQRKQELKAMGAAVRE